MTKNEVDVLGVKFDNLNMQECIDVVDKTVNKNTKTIIAFSNPEIVVSAQKNQFLRDYLNKTKFNVADGIGILYAAKINGYKLKERVTGTDFTPNLIKLSSDKKYNIYLMGGSKGTAKTAAKNLKVMYPNCHIVGTKDGYFETSNGSFDEKETAELIRNINDKKTQILMVCLGCPRQEKWISDNYDKLKANVIFGNGGALDFWSFKVKRAPEWMQKAGLEWLFRLTQDFSLTRIKRQSNLIKFVWLVIKNRILNPKKKK